MTAHVVFEALQPGVPATMSHAVLTGLLRQELGFAGVIVSDDLEMKAISAHLGAARAAVAGLAAGVDLFLVCHSAQVQRQTIEALADAVARGQVTLDQVHAARRRIDALVRRFVRGPEDRLASLGSEAHQALAAGLPVADPAGADPTARS
jgi:beta-N-acetylhexosaminidase